MQLRNIEFGSVFNASGARGFFGEGYPFHNLWKLAGLTFGGTTFISKTTTFPGRPGNLPLARDRITPIELIPKCIKVNFRHGVVLNAVSLSGPGLSYLLLTGQWQQRREPFVISLMAVGGTLEEQRHELEGMRDVLRLGKFRAPIALEINLSCPNVGHDPSQLLAEGMQALEIMGELGRPIILKLNALVPIMIAQKLADHPACDALDQGNTIPWGELADTIPWQSYWGSTESPLRRDFRMGGGLSGKPLLPLICDWITKAREAGITKPIIGGGGILSPRDAWEVHKAGASAISLGTIAILRSWNMGPTIRTARALSSQYASTYDDQAQRWLTRT